MKKIKLLTLQHKNVIDILKTGRFYNTQPPRDIRIAPYERMMQVYRYDHYPIFCCMCYEYGTATGAPTNNDMVLLELGVPVQFCNFQDYYGWSDYIYYLDSPDELSGCNMETLEKAAFWYREWWNDQHPVIQVTIPFIEPSWVSGYSQKITQFVQKHIADGGRDTILPLSEYVTEKDVLYL